MKIENSGSLRKPIDEHCKQCIYDPCAAGTWRQQVTLCLVKSCPLYHVRPISKAAIPQNVLDYYELTCSGRVVYSHSRTPEAPVNRHNRLKQYETEGLD